VLFTISRLGKQATPTKLAKESALAHHTIIEILSRMEKQELVKKIKDLKKKNLIRFEMTEKGYKAFEESRARKSINEVMSILTQQEKNELWSLLMKIRNKTAKQLGINEVDLYPPSDFFKQ